MAVVDDWQSIYAFSGSILPLFTKFCQEVEYGQELKITRTYRNAQELIDIAGTFVQKNSSQIKKSLISPKSITNPVIIYGYNEKSTNSDSKAVVGNAVNNAVRRSFCVPHPVCQKTCFLTDWQRSKEPQRQANRTRRRT